MTRRQLSAQLAITWVVLLACALAFVLVQYANRTEFGALTRSLGFSFVLFVHVLLLPLLVVAAILDYRERRTGSYLAWQLNSRANPRFQATVGVGARRRQQMLVLAHRA